ncbi:hypothetical protein JIN84_01225 [Luteolibacter yonseiensis]|uniref:Uncharacterized protein n=1 Tax=Luteolibacter yonseiensis TaxID=1144680 RepID=A0A934R007_9BACT|nr:hypothetical protein [Luteolibacter yonseiensis]MBK1814229.1 hypothetical protein [Luteolibacter yonseiensis]
MKPNLVIIQPPHVGMDAEVEQLCEEFCESHYVYLIRPHSAVRDDSPAGVRFLNHPLDNLPGFGRVDTAISVMDPEAMDSLRTFYPDSRTAVWDPREKNDFIDSLLKPTVIRGDFGEHESRELARAM